MEFKWVILSRTCGIGERLHGLPYFQYSNSHEALAILTCVCLGMNYSDRVLYLQKNASTYFNFINDITTGHIINDLPDRFNKLMKPLLYFFGLYTTNTEALPMCALGQSSGEDSTDLIDAFKAKQKGIATIKKYKDNIFHASCWWPLMVENDTCCICGCKQNGFIIKPLFYCFDCFLEHAQLENVREVWENKLTDAEGKIIKMFTRYITPKRDIVFFDRDGSRIIYLNKNNTELPLGSETLYQLNK